MKPRIIMPRRLTLFVCIYAVLFAAAISSVFAAEEKPKPKTLITDARIFDGKSEQLTESMSVLVEGNQITKVAKSIKAPADATVIDAKGRTLTPGFVAVHEHIVGQMPFGDIFTQDTRYAAYVATQTVRDYLMNGYTTVLDVAGNTFSLKKAIDRGYVVGPRIYPSGPMISQTSGHSDHRHDSDDSALIGGTWDPMVRNGDMAVVDGVPEVLKAVRENLRRGASQIKIVVGGGTGSYADPLDVIEFTPEEIRAAVQAASDWGTYVLAHVYNSDGIRRAVDNGVKSIEHANLVDEETLRYMKKKDVWLSPQVIVFTFIPKGYTEDQANKHRQAYAGIDNMFTLCKKIGYTKIAFGSDIITDPETLKRINDEFKFRTKWFTPAEILRQATSNGAEHLSMSGNRNPYPGKLGVIEEGAYADLLLINGNPLADIEILTKPDESLAPIMKDGKVYKNTL
ncbi:MAG: amidohydrolase family protein [Desulfobacterales bacterium]|jgi:imidazolonepropionase-like amidohydrolase